MSNSPQIVLTHNSYRLSTTCTLYSISLANEEHFRRCFYCYLHYNHTYHIGNTTSFNTTFTSTTPRTIPHRSVFHNDWCTHSPYIHAAGHAMSPWLPYTLPVSLTPNPQPFPDNVCTHSVIRTVRPLINLVSTVSKNMLNHCCSKCCYSCNPSPVVTLHGLLLYHQLSMDTYWYTSVESTSTLCNWHCIVGTITNTTTNDFIHFLSSSNYYCLRISYSTVITPANPRHHLSSDVIESSLQGCISFKKLCYQVACGDYVIFFLPTFVELYETCSCTLGLYTARALAQALK